MSITKAMSLGSTSGVPSPPNATPRTDVSVAADTDEALDLEAVRRVLEPIQEELNEQADVAMLPSPPSNTPAFSPAPSVCRTRSRGFSLIKDVLTQLKAQPRRDSDRLSNCSDGMSTKEPDAESMDEEASSVGGHSNGNSSMRGHSLHKITASLIVTTTDSIPLDLDSVRLNPRIVEYIQFNSNDLPVATPDNGSPSSFQAVPQNDGSHTRGASFDTIKTNKSGVTEKSTWVEDAEDTVERALLRLEQLAYDNYIVDPTQSMEEHYIKTLQRLLASEKRKYKAMVSFAPNNPTNTLDSTMEPTEVPDEGVIASAAEAAEEVTN